MFILHTSNISDMNDILIDETKKSGMSVQKFIKLNIIIIKIGVENTGR